jgi:hypothetical protein
MAATLAAPKGLRQGSACASSLLSGPAPKIWAPRPKFAFALSRACCIYAHMAAGVVKTLWTMEDIVARMDAAAPKPGRPATYRKKSN